MSNKRNLKKDVNNMVLDVVGECFHIQDSDPSKLKVTEALFDKVADFQDTILQEIHQAKSKKDFNPIVEKINKMHEELTEDMNNL
jgi:mevalonate pyrophosphate decarboxylase